MSRLNGILTHTSSHQSC